MWETKNSRGRCGVGRVFYTMNFCHSSFLSDAPVQSIGQDLLAGDELRVKLRTVNVEVVVDVAHECRLIPTCPHCPTCPGLQPCAFDPCADLPEIDKRVK